MMIKTRALLQLLAASACVLIAAAPASAYQLAQRWTDTAFGPTGPLGSPITLTWSLPPDGTLIDGIGNSDLIASFDLTFGEGPGGDDLTQRPWFEFFERSFARWSELGGVSYVYEPNDDGAPHRSTGGVLGTRGDIRIAGGIIPDIVIAVNDRPNGGDMVLDTGEMAYFAQPQFDFLTLRNVIMHEHGHGLALLHVDSDDSQLLMEAVVGTTAFEGPQIDDIRGLHRAYGDILEKNNGSAGNGTASNATPLGTLRLDETISLGRDAGSTTRVEPDQVDFLSIDDNLDADFFSFDAPGASTIDIIITPVGPTYLEGPRFGTQTLLDSASVSNLTLAIFGQDGSTLLAITNSGGLGAPESFLNFELPAAGRYFARVTGNANDVQMYRLDLTAIAIPEPGRASLLLTLLLLARVRRSQQPLHSTVI